MNIKIKPGLVAFYNIRPGNREGLFWFLHYINLSLTYLDIYPLTYSPGPIRGSLFTNGGHITTTNDTNLVNFATKSWS